MRFEKYGSLIAAGASALAFAAVAQAQDGETPDSTGLDDIVVTATRAATSVQRTPLTLQVLSAETLTKSGLVDSRSLQNAVPGLTFTSGNVGQTLIYMRGTGTSVLGLAAGASVATYVDGVYLSNQQQGLQKFGNIERVEVLKGPQATLFGRNATAGAINVITRQPTDSFELSADASYGNFDAVTLRMTASGPVTDQLSALFSVLYDKHDGYAKNLTLGNRPMADDFIGFRAALKFDPSDTTSITLRGDYGSRKFSDYIKDINPGSFLYFFTAREDYIADPWKIRSNVKNSGSSQDFGASVTLNSDLGFGDLTSITSYRKFNSGPIRTDLDSNDGPFWPAINLQSLIFGDRTESKQLYHETYLATDRTATIFTTVGASYHRERADQFLFRPLQFTFPGIGTVDQTYDRALRNSNISGFIDLGANLGDKLTLTAGVRYSRERKTYSQFNYFTASLPPGLSVGRRTDTSWSPKFGVEYRPNTDLMLYASATSGFKSGGFAENNPNNTFKPEKIWSYEAGFKSTFWDRKARVNVAVFYADYTDIQVQQIIGGGLTIARLISNADGAKIYGVDFDTSFRPVDNLTLTFGGEYLHTKIGDALLCHPTLPCSGTTPPYNSGILNPRGNVLPNAPKWSLIGGFDYDIPLGAGTINLHGDASYRSRALFNYFGLARIPGVFTLPTGEQVPGGPASQAAYVNLNGQIQYKDNAGWSVAVFGQNLTNRTVLTWSDVISNFTGPPGALVDRGSVATSRFAPPRTYGVRFGYSF